MKVRLLQTLFVGVFTLLLPSVSSAQFNVEFGDMFETGNFGTPELTITLAPEAPQPGERVSASVNDYSSSLYGSQITWLFDGEVVPELTNQRSISFTAPPLGESLTIQVVFNTPAGETFSVNRTISPVFLDIILEPQTYVPDFYRGRAIPSLGSIVNATALVSDADSIHTTGLTYTWTLNNNVIGSGPIRGGYKVSFPMPMGDSAVLIVNATEPDGTPVASRAVQVPSVMPSIEFYEVSALYGTKHTALTNGYTMIGNTATVRAVPYNLDIRTFNNPNILEWEVDNQPATGLNANPYEVTLQRTQAQGTSRLKFHVRSTAQVLQGGSDSLTIRY